MNATPAVSQTPIASDPAQLSGAASAHSVTSGGKGADFAAALCKAGAKPNRKSALSMAGSGTAGSGPDGGQLPGTGNLSPPPTMVAGATGAAPEGVSVGRSGPVSDSGSAAAIGPPGGAATESEAKAAVQSATGAATAAPGTAETASGPPSLAPTIAFSLDPLAGAGDPGAQTADAATLSGAASTAATPAAAPQDVRVAETGASVQELAAARAAAAERASAPGVGSEGGRAAITAGASARASLTATFAPGGASSSAVAQANATGSDPSSLGATAAVMAAATGAVADTQGTVDSTLSPAVDSATSVAGSAAVAAAANGAPAPALPVPAGRPAAAAAAAATVAASTAVVATASTGTIGTDKHARSDSGDSLLSDVSAGSAGAAQFSVNAAGAAPGATAAVSPPTLKVAAGVDSAEFGQGLADRLSWMVDNNLSSAKLQVNPPQLGPIEVRIALQGNHAQVWLTSHSAVTRDALESSSPKLREMLGAQGFGQVSVDISQRNFQDRPAYTQPYEKSAVATAGATAVSAVAATLPRLAIGAVDAYA